MTQKLPLEAGDSYLEICGEIFLTFNGKLALHCHLCDFKIFNYDEYALHVILKHHTELLLAHKSKKGLNRVFQGFSKHDEIDMLEENSYSVITLYENDELSDNDFIVKEEEFYNSQQVINTIETLQSTQLRNLPDVDTVAFEENTVDAVSISPITVSLQGASQDLFSECDKADFDNRIDPHLEQQLYHCGVCDIKLPSFDQLDRHLKCHHKVDLEYPEISNQNIMDNAVIISTSATTSDSQQDFISESIIFACEICNNILESKIALEDHMDLHFGKRLYQCALCDDRQDAARKLLRHLQNQHKEKMHIIKNVMKNDDGDLIGSETANFDNNPYENMKAFKCALCKLTFGKLTQLRQHIQLHQDADDNLKGDLKLDAQESNNVTGTTIIKQFEENEGSCDLNIADNSFDNSGDDSDIQNKQQSNEETAELSEATMSFVTVGPKNSKLYQCNICSKTVSSKNVLLNHMDLHVGMKLYQCAICNNRQNSFRQLSRHVQHKHKNEVEKPQVKFNEDTNEFEDVAMRTIMTSGEEFLPENDASLQNHRQPYKCSICSVKFKEVTDLREHLQTHKDDPRTWETDPESNLDDLALPVIKRKRIKKQPLVKFRCDVCGVEMNEKGNLMVHRRRHFGDSKRFQCLQCPKRFHTTTEVKIHERSMHTNVRPYLCTVCGQGFKTSSRLTYHMHIHRNERNHKCSLCPKSFNFKNQLELHMIVHTKERRHKCTTCSATFPTQNSLRVHSKIHENKRAYACKLCDARFNQNAGLYSHMKTTHAAV